MTLYKLTKLAQVSAQELAKYSHTSVRMLQYFWANGKVPFVIIYKISKATGLPIEQIVPESLALQWSEQYDSNINLKGRRGIQPGKPIPVRPAPTLKERVEKKAVSRETATPATPIPQSVTPAKKGKSIAEIMSSVPQAEEPAPDFSNVPDELFSTSADQKPTFKKGR